MDSEQAKELGKLQGEMIGVQQDIADLRKFLVDVSKDVKEIRSVVDQAKGSWKFLVGAATLGASIGAAITYLLGLFGGGTPPAP